MKPWVLLLPLATYVFLAAPFARADYEAVENRLKSARVDPELRARIHASIGRGARFLLEQQEDDGCWKALGGKRSPGLTALCGLALRHAHTPEAREGANRALTWLFPEEDRARSSAVYGDVYIAGITNLLLHADRSHPTRARAIGRALALGIDTKTGWWHYRTPFDDLGGNAYFRRYVDVPNLSTSQFAALGLWAERRFDAPKRLATWARHLETILKEQAPDGSWSYYPARTRGKVGAYGLQSYPTATYMGLANLVLSAEALEGSSHLRRPKTREAAADARASAMRALRRHARWTLRGLQEPSLSGYSIDFPYYDLYALEKVCVFLGVERLGDVAWYVEGARRLLARQSANGSWVGANWTRVRFDPDVVGEPLDTAFALLFLLRISETYRPITPSEVDARPTTPSEAPTAPAPDPVPASTAPRVPLRLARTALAKLQDQLQDAKAGNADVLRSLDVVERAWLHLAPEDAFSPEIAAGLVERWRREAEAVLLDALAWKKTRGRKHPNARHEVNVRAAEILGGTDSRVVPEMIRALETAYLKAKDVRVRGALWDVAFRSLGRLNDPEALRWLFDEVVSDDKRHDAAERTEYALRAASAFTGVPGTLRRELAERVIRTFEGVEALATCWELMPEPARPGNRPAPRPDPTIFWWWQVVRYDAVLAFLAFASDPATGALPVDERGHVVRTMKAARQWWNAHGAATDSVWRDHK